MGHIPAADFQDDMIPNPGQGRRWVLLALGIATLGGATACSRELPLSRLHEQGGLYFRSGDKEPYSGQAADRYPGGGLKAQASFRNGKMTGICRRWHQNGRLQEESGFVDGELHGRQLRWYASGRIRLRGEFRHGRMNGTWRTWDENGTIRQERAYLDGEAHGSWREWFANGRIRSLCRLRRGAYAGLQSEWHENGNLRFQATAWGESCDGSWRKWHADGSPRLFGQWQDNKLEGWWREWEEGGRKIEETFYAGGEPVRTAQWYPDGGRRLRAVRSADGGRWSWRAWRPDSREEVERDTPLLRGLYPMLFAKATTAAAAGLDSEQKESLGSLKQLSDYPLFSMEMKGDPGFVSFLKSGSPGKWSGVPPVPELRKGDPELCSTFMARHRRGGVVFGRNNDARPYPVLVLHNTPAGGHASISVVNMLAMNDLGACPHLAGYQGRASFLRAPYYPQEGMNEKGVAISGMSSPGQDRLSDPRRATLDYEQAIRLVLDHAADLDEAVLLLRSYNLASSDVQHLLIADASGRSAVIEYFDDRMIVIPNEAPWQVATNTPLHGSSTQQLRTDCWRYDAAWRRLERQRDGLSLNEAMEVLRSMAMTEPLETVTSAAYDLERGDMILALGGDFNRIWNFRLERRP